jgi:hypothetical protein
MSIEAMKQALEALNSFPHRHLTPFIVEARNDLRKAIAEAEKQEPVACGHCNGSGRMVRDPDIGTDQECFVCDGSGFYADTHPQPKREWVGLTQNQINRLCEMSEIAAAVVATELLLKEKNHV